MGSDKEKDLNEEFETSAEKIKNSGKTFDNETLLKLYGYYKQGTVGDCNVECPSFWDLKGKSKWDAWNENKGMKKSHAQKKYVKLVKSLL
jgi:acyl-CoA-binding protein